MNVLIIEDDDGSRAILEEHLRSRGWEVRAAASPAQAEKMLSAREADLVLTDIHLPGATGTGHIRWLCERGRGPVVVMTGFPSLETCLDCIHYGAAGYLVKPFRVAELVQIAERAVAERGRTAMAAALEERAAVLAERVRLLEQELARLHSAPPGPPPCEGVAKGELRR